MEKTPEISAVQQGDRRVEYSRAAEKKGGQGPTYFFQPTEPEIAANGDIWTDPKSGKLYKFTGWEEVAPTYASYRRQVIDVVMISLFTLLCFGLMVIISVASFSAGVDHGTKLGIEACETGNAVAVYEDVGGLD